MALLCSKGSSTDCCPTLFSTTSDKLVVIPLVNPDMKCFMEAGRDCNEKDLPIAVVAPETEIVTALVSLTFDVGEVSRRDV